MLLAGLELLVEESEEELAGLLAPLSLEDDVLSLLALVEAAAGATDSLVDRESVR
ncbi:hypothetical protein GCM10009765_75040 [Fodinicola feengrottensis]|uniref:Uncharacterized protein n=1 Tax=Fodinicola feengrottensis TaxID=435914 RepID=A0ABN2IZS2_9ACTN